MASVDLVNLSKTYKGGKKPAIDSVSITVGDGEFLVLLGPSGCGKTTLLRMIAGLEYPDQGSVIVGDRDVTYAAPRDRNLSMVFQSYAIFPHRRVRDNIGFGLAVHGVNKSTIREKIEWAAGLLQLNDYLDRYPAQLSGGQRQRVAVARAIVMDADVLLMDEPLSNLDALLRLNFRAELKRLVQDLGTTTIYVTHDQAEALSLGDRVAVMNSGVVAQCGDPLSVYAKPDDLFVAGFIGSPPMNTLTGRIDKTTSTFRADGIELAVDQRLAQYAPESVVMGIRAENVELAESGLDYTVEAVVLVGEPLGSSLLVTAQIGSQQLKIQADAEARIAPGDKLQLTLPERHVTWYDAETGLRLDS